MTTTLTSLSIDASAIALDCSRRTIYLRIKAGRLQTVRTAGGSQRVTIASLSTEARAMGRLLQVDAALQAAARR